ISSDSDAVSPVKRCDKSALFQFAEISSSTLKMNSPEPTKRCGKSALFHLAEISSSSSHSDSVSAKQCGTSALFQLAEVTTATLPDDLYLSSDKTNEFYIVPVAHFFYLVYNVGKK
ncbi:hypothetical protein GDO81_025211, partial [Engystomops pustulosus]